MAFGLIDRNPKHLRACEHDDDTSIHPASWSTRTPSLLAMCNQHGDGLDARVSSVSSSVVYGVSLTTLQQEPIAPAYSKVHRNSFAGI